MKALIQKAVAYAKGLYAREPARVNAGVLAVATAIGVPVVVGGFPVAVVVAILTLLLLGEGTRSAVYSPETVTEVVDAVRKADKPKAPAKKVRRKKA